MPWKNDTAPSGFTQTWMLWRHCFCRYGCLYPLLVSAIVTSGCLLSLNSSFGCDYIQISVGFQPVNPGWNQSTANIGLFYMDTGSQDGNSLASTFLDGCELYSDSFQKNFIEGDRTWTVARIMALISGAAGIIASLCSWLFLFSPLPVSFFWPGLLLPAILVAFLAEGSKFLLFDSAICRTALWTPSGVDSLPLRADTCSLGSTAFQTIASGCIFFIALMFVCLKAPDKRQLDEDYGRNRYDSDSQHDDVESAVSVREYASEGSYPRGSDVYIIGGEGDESHVDQTDRSLDYESVSGRSGKSGRSGRSGRSTKSARSTRSGRSGSLKQELKTVYSESSSANSEYYNGSRPSREGADFRDGSSRDDRESVSDKRLPEESSREDVADTSKVSGKNNKRRNGGFDSCMSAAEIAIRRSEQQRISESRVSKIERMELSSAADSEDLIEQFVSDLNLSFQQEDTETENALDTVSSRNPGRRKGS